MASGLGEVGGIRTWSSPKWGPVRSRIGAGSRQRQEIRCGLNVRSIAKVTSGGLWERAGDQGHLGQPAGCQGWGNRFSMPKEALGANAPSSLDRRQIPPASSPAYSFSSS